MTGSEAVSTSPLAPLISEALAPLFWRSARTGVESAWYGHVPFAHWIVAAHRPASIVELGSHHGVSYAAFCEAVLRERIGARALAVDTWSGDEHAGFYDDSVYAGLREFHDERYSAFSSLLRATFDEALHFVPDGSIDLLHIDGRHRYEDVAHDFATWRPKLSKRAVVLFHDTNVREGDFGVWRLWGELQREFPAFEFLHGHGLGVLAVGLEQSDAIAALCSLHDTSDVNALRERFAALGERWIAGRDLMQQQRKAAELRHDLAGTRADLEKTRAWATTAQDEVNRLFPQHEQLLANHRAARANLAQARYDIAARDLRDAERKRLLDAQQALVMEREQALAECQSQHQAALATISRIAGLLDATQARNAELEAQRDIILTSTSWKITAPMRRLAGRGGRRTVPAIDAPLDISLRAPALEPPVGPPGSGSAPGIAENATATIDPQDTSTTDVPDETAQPASLWNRVPPDEPAQPASRMLFISGESHTPGTIYRVEHYVQIARRLGYDARWMEAAPVGPDDLSMVRLVVLWRVAHSPHIDGIVTVAHEQGAVVIFDVDDLMFRPELATVKIIDGIRSQHFSEYETQAFFTRIGKTLAACDFVTSPTRELAHQARRMGRPAYVLPNGFDDATHAASRHARAEWASFSDDLLRIGYAGGSRTHQKDFAVAAPAIARVLHEHPDARLTLFRDPSSGEGLVLIDEFPEFADLADRIEWRSMVALAGLPAELARFTINIAPLEAGNPFCEAKSELKVFEAALVGVPTIASPTGPFSRAIRHGSTGMLATTEAEWYAALTSLLNDPQQRQRIGQEAYHSALAHFGPEAQADAFELMLAQAEGGAAGAAAFERERYRDALPRSASPVVPECDVLFRRERGADARVTVIIPVFNYADYVPEALLSVADQTLAGIDLVVVDDCSPDDSTPMVLEWAEAQEARFNRITVLRHRANAGLGFARNSGFAAAATEFVLPLDADNRLRPTACEILLHRLSESRAAFAYPRIQQFGTKSGVFGTQAYSVLRLQQGNYIDAMAMIRKSAWALAGGYDHVQYGWEDFDFWCRLAERGRFGIAVPEVLADYRVHDRSMLHTTTELADHRRELARDLEKRHPWLDLSSAFVGKLAAASLADQQG